MRTTTKQLVRAMLAMVGAKPDKPPRRRGINALVTTMQGLNGAGHTLKVEHDGSSPAAPRDNPRIKSEAKKKKKK